MLYLRVNKLERIDSKEGEIHYPAARTAHNRLCLAQYLNAGGFRTNVSGGIVEYLQDVESFGAYGSLLAATAVLDSVWDVEVVCRDRAECVSCGKRPLSECAANPLCTPLRGYRLDDAKSCYTTAPATCLPFDSLCSESGANGLRDPAGKCWVVTSACVPMNLDGWTQDASCVHPQVICPAN